MADELEDDLTIHDADGLLRRVPDSPCMVKYDDNLKAYRPSSLCFSDRSTCDREVSVTLERPLLDGGGKQEDAIADMPDFGLARLEAGFVRHEVVPAQKIRRAPTGKDQHHALVIGEKDKRAKKEMAKAASLVIKPKGY